MKSLLVTLQALLLFTAAANAFRICWTTPLGMLVGAKPWGPGCGGSIPVNPPAPPPPPPGPNCPACPPAPPAVTSYVTSTVTTTSTSTSYGINPTVAATALNQCMGLNPPRNRPLFDQNGQPRCCAPVFSGTTQVC